VFLTTNEPISYCPDMKLKVDDDVGPPDEATGFWMWDPNYTLDKPYAEYGNGIYSIHISMHICCWVCSSVHLISLSRLQ